MLYLVGWESTAPFAIGQYTLRRRVINESSTDNMLIKGKGHCIHTVSITGGELRQAHQRSSEPTFFFRRIEDTAQKKLMKSDFALCRKALYNQL